MPSRRPLIQFWEMSDAPDRVRSALPAGQVFDWIAIVPPELQDREVLSMLTDSPGLHDIYRCNLPNGELLIASPEKSSFPVATLLLANSSSEAPKKSRSATAPDRPPGSGSR